MRAPRFLLFVSPSNSLFTDSKVRPSKFFKFGLVFKVLWSEPKGETYTDDTDICAGESNAKNIFSKVRRFIIIKEAKGHCMCLSILTYEGRGVSKPGVQTEYHTQVYTSAEQPPLNPREAKKLNRPPIRIIPISSREKLLPKSVIPMPKYTRSSIMLRWRQSAVSPQTVNGILPAATMMFTRLCQLGVCPLLLRQTHFHPGRIHMHTGARVRCKEEHILALTLQNEHRLIQGQLHHSLAHIPLTPHRMRTTLQLEACLPLAIIIPLHGARAQNLMQLHRITLTLCMICQMIYTIPSLE